MSRSYIDIKGLIHNYNYKKNLSIQKPKCDKCHTKTKYIFCNEHNKQKKLGFICYNCNIIYITDKYTILKCSFTTLINKFIK